MINKKHLCNSCLTGKKTMENDAYSQMCPYVSCIEKGKCPMYKKLKEKSLLSELLGLFKGR